VAALLGHLSQDVRPTASCANNRLVGQTSSDYRGSGTLAGGMPEPRPFGQVRQILLERALQRRNPFAGAIELSAIGSVLDRLESVEPQVWVDAFAELAAPHQSNAAVAERAGETATAAREYLIAYQYWRLARYPAPNSPPKHEAYRASQQMYLKAAYWFDPPLERVWMPFNGKPDEGMFVIGDLRKPAGSDAPCPIVVHWGGIDSYKEERSAEPFLGVGLASLAIDMPGVGDAPLDGSEDAERQWDAIFDWIASRPDLDAQRVGVVGASTGGYWAAKLAHTHPGRMVAAVDHGGPAHYAFQTDWIARAQSGEYPFELAETLAAAFGGKSYEDWVARAPSLSLLDQDILEQPSAPLLLVNGLHDSVFPIQDMYLLLEHGIPKSARFYADRSHMGGPEAAPLIVNWLARQLL
jgi:esterase FrsA